METPYVLELPGIINNYTACLRVLKIDDVFKSIKPLLKLKVLSNLEISVNNTNQLILLINNLKTLEILTVQLFNNEDNDLIHDVDTQLVVNLKCLIINSIHCGIGNVWKFNFSNLQILQVSLEEFGFGERQLLTNNTLTNLEFLEYRIHTYSKRFAAVDVTNLKNLRHINLGLNANIIFPIDQYEKLESLTARPLFLNPSELRNFKQLRRCFLYVENVEQLMEFIKLDSLRNLTLLEITKTKDFEFPIEFFKELGNYTELADLYCSFSTQELELLKQFKPPQLKKLYIYPCVSNLEYKFLIEWEDIEFDVSPANGFTELIELQISNLEDKILQEI